MACEEKRLLVEAYKITTAAYSFAVRKLHANIGTAGHDYYRDLRKIADDARSQSERSRIELEDHICSHGC
jgi:hypothetical protein